MIGYLVLYGEAFQNWFELTPIGDDLFLSGQMRLRFLYYGGLSMLAAITIHALACPPAIKRFSDGARLTENFLSTENFTEIERAIKHGAQGLKYSRDLRSEFGVSVLSMVHAASGIDPNLKSLSEANFEGAKVRELDAAASSFKRFWTDSIVRGRFRHTCAEVLRQYYEIESRVRPTARFFTLVFGVVGWMAVMMPALETLIRILLIDLLG